MLSASEIDPAAAAAAVATPPAAPPSPRASRLIAEALVQRQGPRVIVDRASRLGLSPELTRAMVAACGATAVDPYQTSGTVPTIQ